jgi:hypothetical protein
MREYATIRPFEAERLLQPIPKFGNQDHIEARRLLALYDLAQRCCDIAGFCTCHDGCYDRRHWSGRPSRFDLYRKNKKQLLEVVERLRQLGHVTREEIAEVMQP